MKANNNAVANNNIELINGIVGINDIPANAAVLVRSCKKRINGEFTECNEFLAIQGVKSTSKEDLIIPVLALLVAEAKVNGGFNSAFSKVTINGEEIKSGISAKSKFTKWLNTNALYKSNKDGQLTKALVLDNDMRLRNTAFKVGKNSPLLTAKGNDLKVLMWHTTKAIIKQATLFKDVQNKVQEIFEATYEKDEKATEAA